MGFIDAIKSAFARYVDFRTRSSRSEYWYWVLFFVLVAIVLVVVNTLLFGPTVVRMGGVSSTHYGGGYFALAFNIAIFTPSIAIVCRRLHDIDKSGWWQLIFLVPLIGFFIILYLMIRKGDEGTNRFGDDPLAGAS